MARPRRVLTGALAGLVTAGVPGVAWANQPGALPTMAGAVFVIAAAVTVVYGARLRRREPELAWRSLAWRVGLVLAGAVVLSWLVVGPVTYVMLGG